MTLLPLLLALAPVPRGEVRPEAISRAIDKGVDFLLSMQNLDGSWSCSEPWRYPDGGTALVLYALLKSGVPKEHAAVRRALAFLERFPPPTRVYSAGCVLMALCEHDPVAHKERIRELVDFLHENRNAMLWAYPEGNADLSNTQYAVLGLHAAATKGGVPSPSRIWESTARTVCERQKEDGGFSYDIPSGPTGSMTAAGVATLAIARQHLVAAGAGGRTLVQIDASLGRGKEWLARMWSPRTNPDPANPKHPEKGADHWLHYWLYAIERAGAYAGFEKLGQREWYLDGAEFLLKDQNAAGYFGGGAGGGDLPKTAFSLLFLRRASAPPTTGEWNASRPTATAAPRWPTSFGGLRVEREAFSLRAEGGARMRVGIGVWGVPARTLEWPGEDGRGPRVKRVEYRADGERLAQISSDGARPADAESFTATLAFRTNGAHTLTAIAIVATPKGGEATLESAALPVAVFDAFEEAHAEAVEEMRANLTPRGEPAVEVSSEYDQARWAAERAVDGNHATGWLSKQDDAGPWIRLDFRAPVVANRLKLAHAIDHPRESGRYDRATEVAIFVNGEKRSATAKLDPDDRRKHEIDLGPAVPIKTLEIRVVDRVPGERHKGVLGFQEIELFRDGKGKRPRPGG